MTTRLIAGLLLLATFAAGSIAGVVADRWLTRRTVGTTRIVRDYSGVLSALELTAEQRKQAEALMERSAPRSEAVLRQVAEQLRFVADSVDGELRRILSPAQRAKLDSLRRGPVFVIKRKTSQGTVVDTLLRTGSDTIPR